MVENKRDSKKYKGEITCNKGDLKKKEVRFTKVIDRENIADAVFDFVNNK